MRVEDHEQAFEEHKKTIFKWAVEVLGIENSQHIIGTHASQGVMELLSILLHKKAKIDMGFQVNHRWFKSKNVYKKLPDFPL